MTLIAIILIAVPAIIAVKGVWEIMNLVDPIARDFDKDPLTAREVTARNNRRERIERERRLKGDA